MSEPIELREVSIESSALGDDFKPSGLLLQAAVGELPTARVRVHTGVEGENVGSKVMPDFSQMVGTNTKWQKNAFSNTDQKASISTTDNILGGGSTIEMNGIISSPEFGIMPGAVNTGMTLLHEDIKLQNFNTSIYTATAPMGWGQIRGLENNPIAGNLLGVEYNPDVAVAEHIGYVLDETHDNEDRQNTLRSIDKKLDDVRKIRLAIFDQNGEALKTVREFLDNSPNTKMQADTSDGDPLGNSLMFEKSKAVCDAGAYYSFLGRRFLSSGNFLTYIQQAICPSFLFDFICNFDGRARMEHGKWNHTSEKSVSLKIKEIHYNLAPKYQRTLGQVVCQSNAPDNFAAGGIPDELLGAYPNPADPSDGKISMVAAPDWFKATHHHHEQNYIYSPEGNRDIDENADGVVDKQEFANATSIGYELAPSFLSIYAKKGYYATALQSAVCLVKTPLDVSWGSESGNSLGERYAVRSSENGQVLFRGLLNRVTHQLDVSGGREGIAETSLQFTHVKMADFELPESMI